MKQNQFDLIREWANEKGIYEKGNVSTQFIKLSEEQGELARAIINNNVEEQIDAIGDMVVVLTNLSKLMSLKYNKPITIESCTHSAWSVIKDRQGSMKNGTFVKE